MVEHLEREERQNNAWQKFKQKALKYFNSSSFAPHKKKAEEQAPFKEETNVFFEVETQETLMTTMFVVKMSQLRERESILSVLIQTTEENHKQFEGATKNL